MRIYIQLPAHISVGDMIRLLENPPKTFVDRRTMRLRPDRERKSKF